MSIVDNKIITKKEANSERIMQKFLINFLYNEPFFASIIASIEKIKTHEIPTAGVACIKGDYYLYWNPEFITGLTFKQFKGLMKHECYHILFKHCTTRKRKPHMLCNLAQDLAINSLIPYEELPPGGFVPGYYLQKKMEVPGFGIQWKEDQHSEESKFIESLIQDESYEYYFNELMKNKNMFISDEGEPIFQEGMEGDGSCSGENPGNDSKMKKGFGFDSHFDNSDETDSDQRMADAKMKDTIQKAVEKANKSKQGRGWGSVPSEMRGKIDALFNQDVDWKTVMKYFCGSKLKSNKFSTYKKINNRFPYIFPGKKSTHESKIAIFIDQSGSVWDEALVMLFGSLNDLSSLTSFTIWHFDSSVDKNSRYDWKKGEKMDKAYRTRGGGTSFASVERFFETVQREFDGYIIMTDGQAPKPKTSITKRAWLLIPGTELAFQPDRADTVIRMRKDYQLKH